MAAPPGPYVPTPASIFTDRDTLNHHFQLYSQAFQSITAFFEREDRLLSEEKLQFEEWKLAEQQLVNQASAELMRKQQELKQFEADLQQFQRSIEASEREVMEHSKLLQDQQSDFLEQQA